MADTVFKYVGVSGSDLKAVDLGDTYTPQVVSDVSIDVTLDTVFDTWPPLKAAYLGIENGKRVYAVGAVIV